MADDLRGGPGLHAEGGSTRVHGGYGGHLGARPHRAVNSGRHIFRGLRAARWGRCQPPAVAAPLAASADGGTAAAHDPAKKAKDKEKRRQRVAVAAVVVVAAAAVVSAAAARVAAAAAVAAEAGCRAWGRQLAPQWPKRTNRGAALAPPVGSRPISGCTAAAARVAQLVRPGSASAGGPRCDGFCLFMSIDVALYAPCRIALQGIPGGVLGHGGPAVCTVLSGEW